MVSLNQAAAGEDSRCRKLLWFTGIAGKTAADRMSYLQVSVLSAREHAPSLVPVLIYSGEQDVLTKWFEQQGGYVVFHTLSFLDAFRSQTNDTWRDELMRVQVTRSL